MAIMSEELKNKFSGKLCKIKALELKLKNNGYLYLNDAFDMLGDMAYDKDFIEYMTSVAKEGANK